MRAAPPDAVVFDNDGLLLDTESVWTRAEQDLFERRGMEFTPADKRELVGTSAEIAGGILERRLGEPGRAADLIEELNELVVAELEHGVEAMVGARDLLQELAGRGTPLGLVSNSPLAFVRRSLEIVGFEDRFDVVVSGHEVAAPKPAPDPYLEACRRLGVEAGPGVVALEDSPTGVAAARAAGLTVIGIPSIEGVALAEAHHIADLTARRRRRPPPRPLTPTGLVGRYPPLAGLPRFEATQPRKTRRRRRTRSQVSSSSRDVAFGVGVEVAAKRAVGGVAGLGAAGRERRHVLDVAGVDEGVLELDQERLEADPQLQRRLAVAAGVKVGAGAEQQRLAGVDLLAAAEHRGDPLLGAELLLAPFAARGRGADVDVTGQREAARGDLVAAADPDPHH